MIIHQGNVQQVCFFFTHLINIVFEVDGLTDFIYLFNQILSISLHVCKHPMGYSHFQNMYTAKSCKNPSKGKGVKSYKYIYLPILKK